MPPSFSPKSIFTLYTMMIICEEDILFQDKTVLLSRAELDLNILILTEVRNDGVLQSENSLEHEI